MISTIASPSRNDAEQSIATVAESGEELAPGTSEDYVRSSQEGKNMYARFQRASNSARNPMPANVAEAFQDLDPRMPKAELFRIWRDCGGDIVFVDLPILAAVPIMRMQMHVAEVPLMFPASCSMSLCCIPFCPKHPLAPNDLSQSLIIKYINQIESNHIDAFVSLVLMPHSLYLFLCQPLRIGARSHCIWRYRIENWTGRPISSSGRAAMSC